MRKLQELRWAILMCVLSFFTLSYFSRYINGFQGTDSMIYGDVARNFLETGVLESRFIWAVWTTWSRTGEIPSALGYTSPPLYIYVVAMFFKVFGVSFWTMKFVGIVFGALSVIPVFYITKRLLGIEKAIVASLIFLAYPFLILSSLVPGDKIFNSFLVLVAIMFVSWDPKIRYVLLSGVVSGLLLLARFDYGALVFVSAYIYYSVVTWTRRENLKKRFFINGIFVTGFVLAIAPWLIQTYLSYGYIFKLTGAVAKAFTGAYLFFISPLVFLLVISLMVVVGPLPGYLVALVTWAKDRFLPRVNRRNLLIMGAFICAVFVVFSIFSVGRSFLIYVLALVSDYPQVIYQSSPFVFILAGVGMLSSFKKIGVTHPIYTFPFLTILMYTVIVVQTGMAVEAPYILAYLPFFLIFAASTIFDIASVFSRISLLGDTSQNGWRHFRLGVTRVSRHLMLIFLLGSIFLSFLPQYAIITEAEKVQQGPFIIAHFDDVSKWILENTQESDTIMARYPYVTFYTGRRTVLLEPMNITQLKIILKAANVSYIVVDESAYGESLNIQESLITYLWRYPAYRLLGSEMVFEVSSPTVRVFDVRNLTTPSGELVGWRDENFTSGWVVDSALTFKSNGTAVEMAYDNTQGEEPVGMYALTVIDPPINFSEYPFMIVGYQWKSWTKTRYPPYSETPAGYFRVFWANSSWPNPNPSEFPFSSDQAPYPTSENDYAYHTWVWNPTKGSNMAKLALFLRVGEGTKLSIVIDYIVFSKWPVYIRG